MYRAPSAVLSLQRCLDFFLFLDRSCACHVQPCQPKRLDQTARRATNLPDKNNYRVATRPTGESLATAASPKRTCFAALLRCSSSKCPYTLPTRIPPSL